jgi:hypothetical protein
VVRQTGFRTVRALPADISLSDDKSAPNAAVLSGQEFAAVRNGRLDSKRFSGLRQLRPRPRRSAADQFGKRDAEGGGHPPQAEDRRVPLAALDTADEGAVQAARVSELGLREAAGGAEVVNACPDLLQKPAVVDVHA